MIGKSRLMALTLLAAMSAPVLGQTAGTTTGTQVESTAAPSDVSPTSEEQNMLAAVRKQWKANGLGDMTPQQEAAMLLKFRQMRGNLAANMTMMRMAASASTSPANGAMSAQQVAGSQAQVTTPVAQLHGYAKPTTFSDPFNGFVVNGRPWVDPAGNIFALTVGDARYTSQVFAGNRATGDMTYVIQSGQPNRYLVRTANANSPQSPITIGVLVATTTNGWEFTPPEGNTVAGQAFFMLDDGLLMARGDTVFRYRPGSGFQTIALPPGFALFGYQRGDVGTTHFVAIFRAADGSRTFFHQIKSLAGKSEESDLALFNVDTGHIVPLKRTVDDTLTGKMFDGYGNRVPSYYLWSIYWYATPDGPLAVAFEHSVSDVVAIDLSNDHRVTLFTRSLGITEFHASQNPDGTVSVEASWMFKKHEAPDVGAILAGRAPVPTL